jgi:hypothetical protein
MNFDPFPAVNSHSDILFWEIAVPLMCIVVPFFLWSDIRRVVSYFRKKMLIQKVEKKQIRRAKTIKIAEKQRRRSMEQEAYEMK